MRTAPTGAAAMAAHMAGGPPQPSSTQGGWADHPGREGGCSGGSSDMHWHEQQQQQQQMGAVSNAHAGWAYSSQQQHESTQHYGPTGAGEPDFPGGKCIHWAHCLLETAFGR
jgi:hypothetical protein